MIRLYKHLGRAAVASVILFSGCSGVSPTTPAAALVKTYEPVWINVIWDGGRTGAPEFRSVGPGNFTGTYCLPTSLILENHSSRYLSVFSNSQSVLVFKNTCTRPLDMLVCQVEGDRSEFPLCNDTAVTTPLSRMAVVNLGPNDSGLQSTTFRETGVRVNLNIFYCGQGDAFAGGVIPGVLPTDCVQH